MQKQICNCIRQSEPSINSNYALDLYIFAVVLLLGLTRGIRSFGNVYAGVQKSMHQRQAFNARF